MKKSSQPTHCQECALEYIKSDWKQNPNIQDRQYLGLLSKQDAKNYESLCKKDGAAHEFNEKGCTVVNAENLHAGIVTIFDGMMNSLNGETEREGKREESMSP